MNDLLTQDRKIAKANPEYHQSPRTQLATDLIATSARIHRLREQLRRAEELRESQLAEMCARHGVGGPNLVISDQSSVSGTDNPITDDRSPSPAAEDDITWRDWTQHTADPDYYNQIQQPIEPELGAA